MEANLTVKTLLQVPFGLFTNNHSRRV